MQGVIRGLFVAYWALLTVSLLVPDPEQTFRIRGFWHKLVVPLLPYAHLISFFVLAVLALVVRWPAPRWVVVVVLIGYASATEIFQRYVPPRAPQLNDWWQDLGGVLLAAVVCWLAAAALRRPMIGQQHSGDSRKNGTSRCAAWHGVFAWWR
mgnify:CR=1 FL=1